jgi:phenylacetate-CoA ligase
MIEFKLSDFFYPLDLIRTYFLLRRSERWTPAQLNGYQSTQLARLLKHCSTDVPYYHSLFPDIGLESDAISPENARACLQRIPVLDKDVLRDKPDLFLARSAHRYHPKPITTSGTTGTPLTVYWDRGSNVMEFCCIQRLWRWAGIRVGHCFLDLRSRSFADSRNLRHHKGAVYTRNWKANGLEFSSDYINESNLGDYCDILLRYRPRLVRGHPLAIQHLAGILRGTGFDGWRPSAVTTASEALYDFQRTEIEQVWQVPILDSYGLKEHNCFIAQCRQGSYHLSPEYGICEILDDNGDPVSPGQEGWVVATGLHNYAQPLLRYNTRDRAVAGNGEPCPCGRTLPTVARIIGRIDDCIHTADGRRYSGMAFAFFGRRGLKKARLIQEDYRRVVVELVTTAEFDAAERAALLGALESKFSGKIAFELRFVESITQQKPGKFKFVVSNLKNAAQRAFAGEERAAPSGASLGMGSN